MMRIFLSGLLVLLMASALLAEGSRMDREDCGDLPSDGEGYYPGFDPPQYVDLHNPGCSVDPPIFSPLDLWSINEFCGSFFVYLDPETGECIQDEDWFSFYNLFQWLDLSVTTDPPIEFEVLIRTDDCACFETRCSSDGSLWISTCVYPGEYFLGLRPINNGEETPEITWICELWDNHCDPAFNYYDWTVPLQIDALPFQDETHTFSMINALGPYTDVEHLLTPWVGSYDPQTTGASDDRWLHFTLEEATGLRTRFTAPYVYTIAILENTGVEPTLADLRAGGSGACGDTITIDGDFLPGSYYLVVDGDGQSFGSGWLWLEEQALSCNPPQGLVIEVLGGSIFLNWQAMPNATDYAVYFRSPDDTDFSLLGMSGGATSFTDERSDLNQVRQYRISTVCD